MLKRLRAWLAAGLLVWVPVGAVYFVLRFLLELFDKTILLLPEAWRPEALIGMSLPGLGLLLSAGVLLFTGLLVTNYLGDRLLDWVEQLVKRVPLVRSIYSGVKQILENVLGDGTKAFNRVWYVEFPRRGSWTLAFQTGAAPDALAAADSAGEQKTRITLFVPTTPNPTSGYIIYVPEDELIDAHISVEDALQSILSMGSLDKSAGQPPGNSDQSSLAHVAPPNRAP